MSKKQLDFDTEQKYLKALKSPAEQPFMKALKELTAHIDTRFAKQYFKTLFSLFDSNLAPALGTKILQSVALAIQPNEISDIFFQNNFLTLMPFDNKLFCDPILDVLYIMIARFPESISKEIVELLSGYTRRSPNKLLYLIALYSKSFDVLDDPWSFTDLLFTKSDDFLRPDCAFNFLSLISYLNSEYANFNLQRGVNSSKILLRFLAKSNDNEVIAAIYDALASFGAEIPKYPIATITQHLENPELHTPVFNFLMKKPPPEYNLKFVTNLILAANESIYAAILLMKFAQDIDFCRVLLEDASWIRKELPSEIETLRLFCILLKHKKLRKDVAQKKEVLSFIQTLITTNDISRYKLVGTIMKRIPFSSSYIDILEANNFFMEYVEGIKSFEDQSAIQYCYILMNRIAQICYISEYKEVVDMIFEDIKKPNENYDIAITLAYSLSKYEQCIKWMNKHNFAHYLQKSKSPNKAQQGILRRLNSQ